MLLALLPVLPLLAAIVVLGGDVAGQHRRAKLAVIPLGVTFVGSVLALRFVAAHGAIDLRLYDPAAANLVWPIGLLFDRLSTLMMVLISGIGTLIFRYSTTYMYQEPGYGRFLALIGGTTATLLCMVSSGNLVMLFACWQLLSYLLYLLAHNLSHGATYAGARRTFQLLRLGDAAFLAGILLAYWLYGTIEFGDLFARAAARPLLLHLLPGLDLSGPTAITLLLFVGAMTKSAQFPLHVWLPRSLYAPTPVHALLHAGIINAGGFLLNRFAPLYALCPTTLHVAFAVGMLTAVFGACMMLAQNDIKKTLGFSTIGQMGYMITECGLGAFALAVFHLIAHGLFKATVFLNCGNVIQKARQEPKLPQGFQEGPALPKLSILAWSTGLFATLLLPLTILLVAHGVLRVPVLDSQGSIIFLFFIWMTSSQAILTLTRLHSVSSWKVSATMLLALIALVFTYLVAAQWFTAFLYPDPRAVATFFAAAALPGPLFDGIVGTMSLLVLLGWLDLYARGRGGQVRLPRGVDGLRARLYVLLMNHLYLEQLFAWLGRAIVSWAPFRGPSGRKARPMPGSTLALSLVAMATIGWLPFGAFSRLLHLAPPASVAAMAGMAVVLVAWWGGSWVAFDRLT
ncbi:MAG: NADH-quinone oxidoreductase subunit L [Cyanobacteria bacterium REEB65]|nr:NADH-quinone oxidoreductase subunit L [Cyanobacteria bacterium REEB65]